MRVEMITLAAGPAGMYRPGCEYDVSEALGKAWCAAGYARPVKARRETAAVEAPEKAVTENEPKRKRRAASTRVLSEVEDGADAGDGPDA